MNRNAHRLYKTAYEYGLTSWHYTAARIIARIRGVKAAERYLEGAVSSPTES